MAWKRADAGGDPEKELFAFLDRARRRRLLGAGLGACAVSALVNEVFRWGAVGYMTIFTRHVPVLDVGPLLLPCLLVAHRVRLSRAAVAAGVDAGLGLGDRLVSFLDFRGRGDVPAHVRAAQAAETSRRLREVAPAAAAPIGRWRWWAPSLLAASLLYPLFFLAYTETETTTVQIAQLLAPGSLRRGGGTPGRGVPPPGERAEGRRGAPAPPTAGKTRPEPPREQEQQSRGGTGTPPPAGSPSQPGKPRREPPRPEREGQEPPSRFASEPVGTALAKIVAPVLSKGKAPAPPALPQGTFAFHLLPKRTAKPGGAGPGAGETTSPERVAVDFDALPERYRPIVRAYFEYLAGGPGSAVGTPPPPGKELEP